MSLYDQLASRLDFADDPAWATKDVIAKGLIVTHEVSGALLAVYETARGTAVDQAELADALTRVWNEKIVPIDLPVGPMIETVIDRFGDDLLVSLLKPLVDLLEKHVPKK